MDNSEPQYDIEIMNTVSNLLESLPEHHRKGNYTTILQSIRNYIKNNCKHEYINDFIDVDIGKTQKIVYCCKCYTTYT